MFVNRERELAFLDSLLTRARPGPAQLVLLYGRRRVGKTVLLRHWAAQHPELSQIYWTAEKEPAALQRRKLYARLLGIPLQSAPSLASWSDLWDAAAPLLQRERTILILDELPYAAESDPAMLSSLQHAWDRHFKESKLVLVLCGSHVRTMETLLQRQSPLFGRMTGQWHLEPLDFGALRLFFPAWSAEERVAGYALVGGIPAYLEWLDPQRSQVDNLRSVVLAPGSMFVAEPQFLLYDEVREPQTYLAILKAIGAGAHTLRDISNAALVSKTHLSAYLAALQELRLVERRLPATTPPAQRHSSRLGRYHFADPYFRFYFRFFDPFQDSLTLDPLRVMEAVRQNLRAFVGQTAFEELAQTWVLLQGQLRQLPFVPEAVGSHWSRQVQVDVAAINWQTRDLLLGECKWTGEPADRSIVRESVEQKVPRVLRDLGREAGKWRVQLAYFFAQYGFTDAAVAEAAKVGAVVVDLNRLDHDLDGGLQPVAVG